MRSLKLKAEAYLPIRQFQKVVIQLRKIRQPGSGQQEVEG